MQNLISSVGLPKTDQKSKNKGLNKWLSAEDALKEKYEFRVNVILNQVEIREHGKKQWSVVNENNIFRELQIQSVIFSMNNLLALLRSDFVSEYNPFHNYFNNLPKWDPKKDKDYIGKFSSFIEAKNNARFKDMLTKWLIRTIRCAIEPTFFNKHALVLVGETQNSGKSTWCRYLCPQKLSEYIAESIGVDKDSQISMSQNLIINLDELSTLHRSDLQSLKSLFSLETIKCRRPYDRSVTRAPRTASFVGSTDRPEFLSDDAGSVRWICIEIDKISWDYNKIQIDKVWAQAFSLYKQGETGVLTNSDIEENEEVNRKFRISKPEAELIHNTFRPPKSDDSITDILPMTATEILNHFSDSKVRLTLNNIGSAMRLLGFESKSFRWKPKEKPFYAYEVVLRDKSEGPQPESVELDSENTDKYDNIPPF